MFFLTQHNTLRDTLNWEFSTIYYGEWTDIIFVENLFLGILHFDLHLKSSTTFSQCLLFVISVHAICLIVQLIPVWWSVPVPALALEWLWLPFRDTGEAQLTLQGPVSPSYHIFWVYLWSFVLCLLCPMSLPCFSLTVYSVSILFSYTYFLPVDWMMTLTFN